MAFVVDRGEGKLYADGIVFGSVDLSKFVTVGRPITEMELVLGRRDGTDSETDSSQDAVRVYEVAVWHSALTTAELLTMAKEVDGAILKRMPHKKGPLTVCGATPTQPLGQAFGFDVHARTVDSEDSENMAASNLAPARNLAPSPTVYVAPVIHIITNVNDTFSFQHVIPTMNPEIYNIIIPADSYTTSEMLTAMNASIATQGTVAYKIATVMAFSGNRFIIRCTSADSSISFNTQLLSTAASWESLGFLPTQTATYDHYTMTGGDLDLVAANAAGLILPTSLNRRRTEATLRDEMLLVSNIA